MGRRSPNLVGCVSKGEAVHGMPTKEGSQARRSVKRNFGQSSAIEARNRTKCVFPGACDGKVDVRRPDPLRQTGSGPPTLAFLRDVPFSVPAVCRDQDLCVHSGHITCRSHRASGRACRHSMRMLSRLALRVSVPRISFDSGGSHINEPPGWHHAHLCLLVENPGDERLLLAPPSFSVLGMFTP